jgi:hypothetical protein
MENSIPHSEGQHPLADRARELFQELQTTGVRLVMTLEGEQQYFKVVNGTHVRISGMEAAKLSAPVSKLRAVFSWINGADGADGSTIREKTVQSRTYEFEASRRAIGCTFDEAIDTDVLAAVHSELKKERNKFDPVVWANEERRLIATRRPEMSSSEMELLFPAHFAAWRETNSRGRITVLFARLMLCSKVRSWDHYFGETVLCEPRPPALPIAPPNPLQIVAPSRSRPAFYCAVCQKSTAQHNWRNHVKCAVSVLRAD